MSNSVETKVVNMPVKDKDFSMESMDITDIQNPDDGDELEVSGSETLERKVRIRKPRKGREYIRAHPTLILKNITAYTDEDDDDKVYLILPVFQSSPEAVMIMQSARRVDFYPYINVKGEFHLWKVSRYDNSWNNSARALLKTARDKWVAYNSPSEEERKAGEQEYICNVSTKIPDELPRPFPDWDLVRWMREALNDDQIIHNADHKLVKHFNGEMVD